MFLLEIIDFRRLTDYIQTDKKSVDFNQSGKNLNNPRNTIMPEISQTPACQKLTELMGLGPKNETGIKGIEPTIRPPN